jgi:hypothetical protein
MPTEGKQLVVTLVGDDHCHMWDRAQERYVRCPWQLPGGGTIGQALVKSGSGDWEVAWDDVEGGAGGPHAASHQNGGADEISVAGLLGVLAEPQTPAAHVHAQSEISGLVSDLAAKATPADVAAAVATRQLLSEKGLALGYASLGADGKVPSAQLPPGGSGGGNGVEVSIALTGAGVHRVTVTGCSWVTASTLLVASPFATPDDGLTPELYAAAGLSCMCANRVAGVGFDLFVRNPTGAVGTFRVHVLGV